MDNHERIKKNKNWGSRKKPFFTVITPVYNRRQTILRAIDSIERQTFRNIEYIIIDDGSKESIDDLIADYMDLTDLPVLFIKKKNGGVHTARNIGYKYARGELVICLDSDDELLPEACEIFHKTWLSIPEKQRGEYWQIKAQCIDQEGNVTGSLFPENINLLTIDVAKKYFSMAKGEQIGCRVAKIMKDNLFPEPSGVTFVAENVRWVPLESRYKSWGINDIVRVYHKEGDNHLSAVHKKKTVQDLKNSIWNLAYQLNNQVVFNHGLITRLKLIGKYYVFANLLKNKGGISFVFENKLDGSFNRVWSVFLWLPAKMIACRYNNH